MPTHRDVLERAWELVRANYGAAGIDQTTIADVEQYGVFRLLDELAADLKVWRYQTGTLALTPLARRRPRPSGPRRDSVGAPTGEQGVFRPRL